MKKIMLVAVAAVLALSLVGCKGGKKSNTMNISVFSIQTRSLPSDDNKAYKWIKDNFGVEFTWDLLAGGDAMQKKGVLIASGDLPDLVEVDDQLFQNNGVLYDLKPWLEQYCPNLMKHYSSAWKKMLDADSEKDSNGNITVEHIYSLPNFGVLDGVDSGTSYNQNGWWVQKRVLKDAGWPTIKTVDQYFDLIEAYYKKNPTTEGTPTVPFSILTNNNEAFNLWNPPNFLAGYPNDGNGHVTLENGKYVYTDNFTDDNAYRWFKLANGYFQRGLIDPESFTDNHDQYFAKIAQGRVLGMFIQGWQFMYDAEMTLKSQNKGELTYVPLPLTFDESIKPYYRDTSLPNLQRGYGITTSCSEEKAIKILKFMDEMLKEENQKILYWGFEGEDYLIDTDGSVTGKKGAPYRTQELRDLQEDSNWLRKNAAELWREEAPKLEGTMPSGYTRTFADLPQEFLPSQKDYDKEVWAAYGVNNYAEFVDPNPPLNNGWYPMWQCNPSAGSDDQIEDEAAVAMKGFETVQFKYLPMMIMGKPADFDKTWNEYCKLLKPLTEKYNKFMQRELDARVAKFGGFSH